MQNMNFLRESLSRMETDKYDRERQESIKVRFE